MPDFIRDGQLRCQCLADLLGLIDGRRTWTVLSVADLVEANIGGPRRGRLFAAIDAIIREAPGLVVPIGSAHAFCVLGVPSRDRRKWLRRYYQAHVPGVGRAGTLVSHLRVHRRAKGLSPTTTNRGD